MKKRLAWVLILVMAVAIAGCSGGSTAKIEKVTDLKGKVIGTVSTSAITADEQKSYMSKPIGGEPKEIQYFKRYPDCVTALETGKVDAIYIQKICADYYAKRNSNLKVITYDTIKLGFIMAVRSEDQLLRDDLDKAITTLQDNGTLKRLENEWVTNLPAKNEPTSKEIPKIDGAKTVYVGVCGNFLPLDYIAADGRPAGYNVALLTEIGKLLDVNFEFVSLEPQARFAALSSKKIDVIFCQLGGKLSHKNCIGTKPYYSADVGCFLVKK